MKKRGLSVRNRVAGLSLVLAIVAGMSWLDQQFNLERFGVGVLLLSLVSGMVIGNMLRLPGSFQPGIHFAQQKLLRAGVMLFGLHVSLGQLLAVGWQGLGIDLIVMSSILVIGTWVGIRLFGLERDLAVMTAAGSAICGAAAVLATEPVVRGNSEHTSMAVATVVVFGTLAMLVYPAIYHFSGLSVEQFGIYIGATVHEVAQVVAVGHSIGDDAERTAVIVKLMRVMLLAPALLLLSFWWQRQAAREGRGRPAVTIPWFAFGFVLVVIVNSFWHMAPALHGGAETVDGIFLAAAMAALGLETRIQRMRVLGIRPFLFAASLFLALSIGGDFLARVLLSG